ncbi:3-keto-5-aminohexanoate cleavage protein, partial [Anaerospora hongkongensis]
MGKKVIITAAITGAVHIPSMSEYLPVTPEQIIDEAVAAHQAGAAVVHLHARDPQTGKPTGSPELMKQITDGIRSK